MLYRLLFLWLLLCVTAAVLAQVDPAPPTKPAPPGNPAHGQLAADRTVVTVTPLGIYLLSNGVVARFDANLQPLGACELFGPLPAQPTVSEKPTDAERAAVRAWLMQVRLRQAPLAAVAGDNMLHVMVDSHYFRVNAETLVVAAHKDLAPTGPTVRTTVREAPALTLIGEKLLVQTARELLLVQTVDGAVLSRTPPPPVMFPTIDFTMVQKALGSPPAAQPTPKTPKP